MLHLAEVLMELGEPREALEHLAEARQLDDVETPAASTRHAVADALEARARWALASTPAEYATAGAAARAALQRWSANADFDTARAAFEQWVASL